MSETDIKFLRAAIAVAQRARRNGNNPFGSVLVDGDGKLVLEAENSTLTERDPTGHAETNLARRAFAQFDSAYLAACTLYTSTEPCAMCCGAIFWAGIGRVVYALSQANFHQWFVPPGLPTLHLPSREVFARGERAVEVVGPAIEEEARTVHEGYWTTLWNT